MDPAPLAPALTFLERGQDREALALLQTPREGAEEAERLALLGFLRLRQGDPGSYRALVLEAARRAQTPLTLYHLGLALPPHQGLPALEEAFQRAADPKAKALLARALARTLRRLGRFREALAYAALARLQSPSPYAALEWAWLSLLAEEEPPLPHLLRLAEPLALEEGPALYARFLMAHLRLLQGEEGAAQAYFQKAVAEAPPASLPYLAPAGVRLLRAEALPLLQAARPWAREGLPKALLDLAFGLFQEERERVAQTLPLLLEEAAEEALRALLFLRTEHPLLGALSSRGLRALWREGPKAPYLWALGGPPRLGEAPLPLRQAEALALLLAHPEGLSGEALSEALYGEAHLGAVRMEVARLRARGLPVGSRPYRLEGPLGADFLDLRAALGRGDLKGALALYRGPLLPESTAPGVEALRADLEEALKAAVLARGGADLLFLLAERLGEDPEVWEALLEALPPEDPRRPIARARVARLKREWGL